MTFDPIISLFHQATAQGSRSTVLRPLQWFVGICIVGLLGCLKYGAPVGVLILFAVMVALIFLLFMGAYIHCLRTDKDALRSETYSIQKLAIERGLVGDSIVGILEIEEPLGGNNLIGPDATKTDSEDEKQ